MKNKVIDHQNNEISGKISAVEFRNLLDVKLKIIDIYFEPCVTERAS